MKGSKLRRVLMMALAAIVLLNYANATLFWHCHKIGSVTVTHSHIYWKNHKTGDPTGGHTPGQLQVIDVISHAVYTAGPMPGIHLERMDVLELVLNEPVVSGEELGFAEVSSLRGPPGLV